MCVCLRSLLFVDHGALAGSLVLTVSLPLLPVSLVSFLSFVAETLSSFLVLFRVNYFMGFILNPAYNLVLFLLEYVIMLSKDFNET